MNSLRDQMLQAGLVTEDQVRDASRKKTKPKNKAPKRARKAQGGQPSEADRKAQQKRTRDQRLNEQRRQEQELKAAQAQIRQILEQNRIDHSKGEVLYRYPLGDRVKQIYVTEEQHRLLTAGKLAITGLKARACLVPLEIAEKIRALDSGKAMFIPTPGSDAEAADGYEEFEVPDDLTW